MLLYFVVVIFAQQCGSAQAVLINKHGHAKHPSSSKPSCIPAHPGYHCLLGDLMAP
jgi:hypothetical protein